MPRGRVYGRRKQKDTAAVSVIFGTVSSPNQQPPVSPINEPLEELTAGLTNLTIRNEGKKTPQVSKSCPRVDSPGKPRTSRLQCSRLEQEVITKENGPTNTSSVRLQRSQQEHLSPKRDNRLKESTPNRLPPSKEKQRTPKIDSVIHKYPSARLLRSHQKRKQGGKAVEAITSSEKISKLNSSDNVAIPVRSRTKRTADDLALLPLIQTYKIDCGRPLPIERWNDVLPLECGVSKIAEASYAEVYRVSIDGSESILKVMQLKMPSDKDSLNCYTASDPNQVVSEIRIMNLLTEYPGFVTFKAAHLIRGKPSASLIRARNDCEMYNPATGLSEFPDPSTFTENSISLVIELGDAGQCLDKIEIKTIHQLWDVFLGVVIALAAAECYAQFEHRDLHESNICVLYKKSAVRNISSGLRKYGNSGMEVTILDYGLSRAMLLDGNTVFNDLERDLEIFQGSSKPQFDTYRRMRTHLFTGLRLMHPKEWYREDAGAMENMHGWDEFTPYSNVLWIKYILGYLVQEFKKHGLDQKELAQFNAETKELKKRLNTKTLITNGAFMSAGEVCGYVVQEGWVSKDTLLSESNSFTDSDDWGSGHGE